jgi:hypothetical protein
MEVRQLKTARWIVAGCAWSMALGCGPPLPPPEAKLAPAPATAAPIAADPYEEVVYPESPPASQSATASPESDAPAEASSSPETYLDKDLLKKLVAAEEKASAEGRRVLETGRQMALVDREVILGACWDYANTVYKRAGFPSNKRKTVFNHSKKGPYADPQLFKPGDFLSYSHDEKGEWVHSAIFVDWTNAGERVALMLTYPGGSRPVPAYYSDYVLNRVFRVVRPKP